MKGRRGASVAQLHQSNTKCIGRRQAASRSPFGRIVVKCIEKVQIASEGANRERRKCRSNDVPYLVQKSSRFWELFSIKQSHLCLRRCKLKPIEPRSRRSSWTAQPPATVNCCP